METQPRTSRATLAKNIFGGAFIIALCLFLSFTYFHMVWTGLRGVWRLFFG